MQTNGYYPNSDDSQMYLVPPPSKMIRQRNLQKLEDVISYLENVRVEVKPALFRYASKLAERYTVFLKIENTKYQEEIPPDFFLDKVYLNTSKIQNPKALPLYTESLTFDFPTSHDFIKRWKIFFSYLLTKKKKFLCFISFGIYLPEDSSDYQACMHILIKEVNIYQEFLYRMHYFTVEAYQYEPEEKITIWRKLKE